MAREIFFTKDQLGRLRPADARSAELWDELPRNKGLKAVVTQPRNYEHHKKFMALINVIWEHQTYYPSPKSLRRGIQRAVGLVEVETDPRTGQDYIYDGSIAFDKMDQAAFEDLYDRAVEFICAEIIPGLGHDDLRREVEQILVGRK